MPKAIAQWPTCSGSVSIQNKPSRLKRTDSESAIYKLPSDLPRLCRQPDRGTPTVPSHLALNSEERGQLQSHLDLVGVDRHRFDYTQEDQGVYLPYLNSLGHSCAYMLLDHAFHLLSDLNLHLGINDIPRNAQSKMSIMYSDSGKPNKKYTQWTHLYQCLCRTNHEEGRYPSKKRFRPWKNVKCDMYAWVTSMDDGSESKQVS
jgi:hypothetical protein